MLRLIFLIPLLTLSPAITAQTNSLSLQGQVTDTSGEHLPGITVQIKGTQKGAATDTNGFFEIKPLSPGNYQLKISGIGFQPKTVNIEHPSGKRLSIQLQEEVEQLQDVVITSSRRTQKLKSSGLNVSVIDAAVFQDLNMDVNQVIGITSGVNIRETGGLGSSFDLSLNGLSGKQVRYFIDGVPMEFFGSALSLNNFSANLIESIEIYKGVVPIDLASDALGGSINVTTPKPDNEFLDLSYSYGSFNTHRASAFYQAKSSNDLFLRLSSSFNHSDNNYWMDDVPVADEFGNITGSTRARRFHNAYTSGTANVRMGVLDKKLADELSLDLTYAQNQAEIQHSDFSINRVYGGLNEESESLIGVLRYNKQLNKFNIQAKGLVGESERIVNDEVYGRRYRWDQSFMDINAAELFGQLSEFHIIDQFAWANLNTTYSLSKGSDLKINLSHNQLSREGYDKLNENNLRFTFPSDLYKDIAALSYQYRSKNNKFQTSIFGKQYFFNAVINAEEYVGDGYQNVETKTDFTESGFGATARYTLTPQWTMKLSFEKAYRLPEAEEILGDGVFVDPNPQLTAESSFNVNYGAIFSKSFKNTRFRSEANLFYRPTQNFIRLINDRGILGRYYNVDDVRILGVESSSNLNIDNKYVFGLNWTYQSITDRTEFYEGLPNDNLAERIPNTPYFFWNVRAGYNKNFNDDSRLSVIWTSRYVHEFFLYWERFGNRADKNQIPTQFIHDLDINYSFRQGKYNTSLAVRNIFDAQAYDNFNIQKPGRAFFLKIRYFLNNN